MQEANPARMFITIVGAVAVCLVVALVIDVWHLPMARDLVLVPAVDGEAAG
jgi:hypothetical protein